MFAAIAKRSGALYVVSGLAVGVLLYLGFQVSYDPSQLDPHPPLSPWNSLFPSKTPYRHIWLAGRGRCKRTLRIKLDASSGLGSSLILLIIPGLTMAHHYGYTPLVDDSEFNYGRLTDFIEPMQLDCDPGGDWATRERHNYHTEGWETADHVELSRYEEVDGRPAPYLIDDFWRSQFMLRGQSKAVAGIDEKALLNAFTSVPYLPSEMSFTQAVRPAFRVAYHTLSELFNLNSIMKAEVESLVRTTRQARRDGIPVLGAVVRLGDKVVEANVNPGANAYENWQGYAEVLREQYAVLSAGRNATKPILVLMSDDIEVATAGMRGVLGADEFDIRPIEDPVSIMPLLESDDRYEPAPSPPPDRRRGHVQDDFNHQPVLERIASAKTFIRDLYYISKHTDSLVVSSTSNAGRVALLLAGEEKAYGDLASDAEPFKAIGGLSRSIDTRWFPCVFYSGCFQAGA